jgi:molybdate transport system substrate-binding protein
MRWQGLLTAIAGCAFAAGCGSDSGLTVHCGAGIQPPVAELIEIFEREHGVDIAADYAGSEVLLAKIKIARSGDVYLPGDKHYIEMAEAEGFILEHRSVCYFVPTILVQKDNPRKIGGLRDLARPGLKLGLGDAKACAIGRKTRKIMEKNGIPWADVEKNLVFQSLTVNELGMQIQADSLDAVIVWDAIAGYYEDHGDAVAIPTAQNVISTVNAGVLSFSKDRDLAGQFVAFLASARGREVFRKHRYRVDPPE